MIETSIGLAVVIALAELIKRMGFNTKYIPLVNLVLGVLFSAVYSGFDFKAAIFNGIVIGLTASGMYSGVKNVAQGIKSDE